MDFHATGNCPPRLEHDLDYNAKEKSVVRKRAWVPPRCLFKLLEPKRGVGPGPRKMGPGRTRVGPGWDPVGPGGTRS